jgi:hypothetical protein
MAYEMTIRLTDEEYAALAAEAARNGKRPETLLHDIMRQRLQPSLPVQRSLTELDFSMSIQYTHRR